MNTRRTCSSRSDSSAAEGARKASSSPRRIASMLSICAWSSSAPCTARDRCKGGVNNRRGTAIRYSNAQLHNCAIARAHVRTHEHLDGGACIHPRPGLNACYSTRRALVPQGRHTGRKLCIAHALGMAWLGVVGAPRKTTPRPRRSRPMNPDTAASRAPGPLLRSPRHRARPSPSGAPRPPRLQGKRPSESVKRDLVKVSKETY